MKQITIIGMLALMAIAVLSACARPSYFGKSYPATENVDVYYDASDIKKEYTTMGTSEIDKDLRSLEATQQKVIELAKSKGADGVITKLTEEDLAIQQSGGGVVNQKTKFSTYGNSSTTTRVTKKKILATFIKYN